MGLQTQMPIVAREAMQMRGVRSGKYKIMGLCCACVVHLEERYSPAPAGGCHGRMQTQCSRSEEAKNQSFMRKQLATNLKKILYTQCRWNKTHQWAKIGPCLQPLLNNVASLEESNLISVSQYRGSISSLLATWVALPGHEAQVKALPCMWEKANVSRVLRTQVWCEAPVLNLSPHLALSLSWGYDLSTLFWVSRSCVNRVRVS